MAEQKKIQLYTDRACTVEASPETSAKCVILSDGNDLQKVLDNDLTNPTVVHEETSFKVGVGDIDVSSSVVDGEVGRMVIKGKTYQNILPEPSTHVLTNNKEMFKVNEGLDPNVEIVDGVSKSAILSGQTLVNMVTFKQTNTNASFDSATNVITLADSTGWIRFDETRLKPSTKYIIIIDILECTLGSDSRPLKISLGDGTLNAINVTSEQFKVGRIVVTETTPSTILTNYFNAQTRMGSSCKFKLMVIEYREGMENWDIPYFTGMQSVKMPVLQTIGKNLSPINSFTGIVTTVNDSLVGIDKLIKKNIVLNPNKTYICSTKCSNNTIVNNMKVLLTNIELPNNWIEGSSSHNSIYTWTVNNGGKQGSINTPFTGYKYAHITTGGSFSNQYATKGDAIEYYDIQLEEGSTPTTYEPYKSNILSCELVPMNQSMFEQGSFSESTTPNTRPYEGIKLNSGNLYDTRIRTKGTYKVVQGATYEGQLNDGYGIFICYCKNGLYSTTVNRWFDETRFAFTVPNDCDEMFFALRKTDNSAITPSDYSRIGLKIHQEVVLRSLPNGVCDTLNLMTGEYVQRIKEVVFDGSSDESIGMVNVNDTTLVRFNINNVAGVQTGNTNKVLCSSLPYLYIHGLSGGSATVSQECISNHSQDANVINIVIKRSRLSSVDVAGFRAYLQSNPITIQYSIATPIVKTVDLSSSGNWEKVVLDGSEDWGADGSYCFCRNLQINSACAFTDSIPVLPTKTNSLPSHASFSGARYFTVLIGGILNDPVKLKQYLSQNPMTVWYQTTTHQDSTQVKQPIFFKEGHIIQSSGVDNSLIPTLDYQAKTSNSYVMDLMKPNTRYTMKAKSASGTFTIDGTSYGAGTNGTFTTPSSMTNKLLVMSNKTNEEVMILEGDVVSKTIPYFKGIRSAFEGESKIEVLSTGKNLFDGELELATIGTPTGEKRPSSSHVCSVNFIKVKPSTTVVLTNNNGYVGVIHEYDKNYNYIKYTSSATEITKTALTANTEYVLFRTTDASKATDLSTKFLLQVANSKTDYEPYKSNSTKIPLLSPLRSLQNGVCDELIIDRMKKKATLIQRVGHVMLDGSEEWGVYPTMEQDKTLLFQSKADCKQGKSSHCVSDRFPYSGSLWNSGFDGEGVMMGGGGSTYKRVDLRIYKGKVSSNNTTILREYLSKNPITVCYELKTPVVTEIDLENFPLVYKDGHIFLNSEIAPVVEIDYNVNQTQQIQANNETLQRHELDILDLDNLIVSFVNAEYNLRLLKFDMELSMMALAE